MLRGIIIIARQHFSNERGTYTNSAFPADNNFYKRYVLPLQNDYTLHSVDITQVHHIFHGGAAIGDFKLLFGNWLFLQG
jgi:hypothetical protein